MFEVVKQVAQKEHLDLPEKLGKTIASKSNRSLRRALLMLETCRVEKYPFSEDDGVQQPEWERFLEEVAKDILKEQSPKMLFQVRGKLYELLINNMYVTRLLLSHLKFSSQQTTSLICLSVCLFAF